MIFALAGNQNCGKTTLFNQLTGANQHVGNFPGVTVERKSGSIKGKPGVQVVDLPGIYSLSPYTSEEIVTRDFLLSGEPDGIINIVDATNIERNLYLSMQLVELGLPMVLALNMMDEVRASGASIDIHALHEEFGVRVVPISASKNEGVAELVAAAISAVERRRVPKRMDFCSGAVHRAIHATAHMIEDHAEAAKVPVRFAATKLIEGDEPMLEKLRLSENEKELLGHTVCEMERELSTDREAAMADMRYSFIEELCGRTVTKAGPTKEHERSVKIDALLTHRYFAIPIFLAIMATVFWLTFSVIGAFLSDLLEGSVNAVTQASAQALSAFGVNPVMQSLVIDGIFAGVGSVLSFLPIIVVLFFFLSLLEDSGYMARVAFVMDGLLRRIGLSGRSFVPMLIGFGCSVPAILATRTLASERDRRMTILLIPFMSCSAKLPIYALFTAVFFPKNGALVMVLLYIGGMVLAVLAGLLLKDTVFVGNPVPFVMELPSYRLPSPKSVALLIWDKVKDFLTRAFTVIFVASIVIWVLQTFDIRFNIVADSSASMLAGIGRWIAPVFSPLGFGDWRAATALLSGFMMKEAVVSTFAVLMPGELAGALQGMFTTASAAAFLVFTLLYTPCVAAVSAVKKELDSGLAAFGLVVLQSGIAWAAAFCVFWLGRMMGF